MIQSGGLTTADQIIRSRRKTIALEITHEARLIVRAPFRVASRVIEDLLSRKRDWILRKQSSARLRSQEIVPKRFVRGELFLYLGQAYPLSIEEGNTPFFFEGIFRVSPQNGDKIRENFTRWYRAQAARVFAERIELYAAKMGLARPDIKISNAGKRWGSCSPRGKLCFSWRLLMAPLSVVDYVVVHELAHIPIRNHSSKFWKFVRMFLPDFEGRREWLKNSGHILFA